MAEVSEAEDLVPEFDLVGLQGKWKKVLEKREKQYSEYWHRAKQVVQRYEDRRNTAADAFRYKGGVNSGRKYNILWSNTETMMPLLFNKVPDPVVKRKWGDDRPVARTAAEMLERASTSNIQRKDVYFVDNVKASVHNMLVPGTGQLWTVYDAELQQVRTSAGPINQVGDQVVYFDYVHWRDFLASKANTWSQVDWVARKLWMTPQEVGARWGEAVQVMCHPQRKEGEDNYVDGTDKCCIYEIWDKVSGTVLFFSKDMPRLIEVVPDPLGLKCFFPCPKPLFGMWSTSDVIPSPIYCQYQDQAMELDTVTSQIYNLLRACKVSGVYNEKMGADFQRMLEGNENKVIPVTDWNEFTVTGSMVGNVVFMPLGEVVQALQALYQAREAVKADLNEITGMPDIFRGQSSPLDAEGTNDLKVQWGASRMRDDQREVQRFCADLIALSTEIMAEHFTPENLVGMSGMNLPTEREKAQLQQGAMMAQATGQPVPQELQDRLDMPSIESVMQLIRSEKLRGFSLDVESDSTVEADDTKERTSRAEFLEVLTGMVERWWPIVERQPVMLPMVKELIMFSIAPFRAGRQLEEEVERMFKRLEQMAKAAMQQPPKPDAMDKAAQIEMQKTAMQEQGDTQRTAMKEAGDTQRKVMDIAAKQDEARVKAIAEVAREVVAGE